MGFFDRYLRGSRNTGRAQQFEHHRVNSGVGPMAAIVTSVVKLEDGCIVTFSMITERKLQNTLLEERALLLFEAEGLANSGSWKMDGERKVYLQSGPKVCSGLLALKKIRERG
jgi:hypothetical protein